MTLALADLGLTDRLAKKLHPCTTVKDVHDLGPLALRGAWNLTEGDLDDLNEAMRLAGQPVLPPLAPRPPKAPKAPRPRCAEVLEEVEGLEPDIVCGRALMAGKRRCPWHWLLAQPIAVQIVAADQRRAQNELAQDFVERVRAPAAEWPEGERWCSECQGFVPLFYVQGSKCKAHNSRASHASMVKRVYDLSPEEYDSLLAWQRGRCFICQQIPRAKRLAVDHDHVTNEVRGLLCANDEWGCNVTLRRLLNNVEMARRALAYVERWPLSRMRAGEPAVALGARRPAAPVEQDPDSAFARFFGGG